MAKSSQPRLLLFDLASDLGEQKNLADTHADIVRSLRERLDELDAEITANSRAPWLKP